MVTSKKNSASAGVSELGRAFGEVLERAKRLDKVVIKKRNKPVAALVELKKYEEMENLLDAFEDIALGSLAGERDRKSSKSDFLSLEEVEDMLN